MAFGFTPNFKAHLPFEHLTPVQFLALAREACNRLGWDISSLHRTGLVAYTNNGLLSWNAEITITLAAEGADLVSISTGTEIVDFGRNKRCIRKFLAAFQEAKETTTEADLALLQETLHQELITAEKYPEEYVAGTSHQPKGFIALFKPVSGYYATPVLVYLNLAVFLLMVLTGSNVFLPDNGDLLSWGASFRPLVLEGQVWRLLTSCFVHIGIFHLLMNMYALVYIGLLLEPRLGTSRFLCAYLFTGILASTTSLWWHELTVSAGASGAIFGMYGVFLALLTTNLIHKAARKPLLASISVFVLYNLMNGMKGGIDNAAHLGGVLSGFALGYAFVPSLREPDVRKLKLVTLSFLGLLTLTCTSVVYKSLPEKPELTSYAQKMQQFTDMEAMALEVFSLPADTPKERLKSELKDRGLYYWSENVRLLEELDELELPDELKLRNRKLKRYCALRKRSYQLLYRSLEEDTDKYQAQIERCNKQIEALISELQGHS